MKAEIAFKNLQRQKKLDIIAHKKPYRDAPFVDNAV